jgi:branched-chain amino acid transport system ATP-binding protein
LAEALLSVSDLHTYLGESHILQGITLAVGAGEVVALLGRNGAGKTTALRTLMGLVIPRHGRVLWRGEDVAGWPAHRRVRAGIAYVPQDRRMFRGLTVEQNLEVAERPATAAGAGGAAWTRDAVYALFPVLQERRRQLAGRLSGGEQRMLAIARALVANPALVLCDEPTDGLAPVVVEQLFGLLGRIAAAGTAILLAEQNVRFAGALGRRGYVIDKGRIRGEGAIAELLEAHAALARHLAL